MKNIMSICLIMSVALIGCAQDVTTQRELKEVSQKETTHVMSKTDDEWKSSLSPEQYNVLRQKGTEQPYTGIFDKHTEAGKYTCAGCGEVLFTSEEKFDAGCGWPSFSDSEEGKVATDRDVTLGMARTEILCANCGGHLGHVFNDGPTATGQRYCVNSLSLDFTPEGESKENEKEEEK